MPDSKGSVPILEGDNFIFMDSFDKRTASEQILALNTERFTRFVKVEILTPKPLPENEAFPSLEALISYTNEHLERFTKRIGAKVVPHTFGLVPIEIAQDAASAQRNYRANPRYKGCAPEDLNGRGLVPDGYYFGCEVSIIDPLPPDSPTSFPNLTWEHVSYTDECVREGNLALSDVEARRQYTHGTIRGSSATEATALYLLDIEPRFKLY